MLKEYYHWEEYEIQKAEEKRIKLMEQKAKLKSKTGKKPRRRKK
jgi:hypothetical protein